MSPNPAILLVEDHPGLASVLRDILERAGFQVHPAVDVASARATLDLAQLDAVLTDFRMPGGDGLDLCRAVRAHPRGRSLPVIVHTALEPAAHDRVRRALALPGVTLLLKPAEPGMLLSLLTQATRARSAPPGTLPGTAEPALRPVVGGTAPAAGIRRGPSKPHRRRSPR